MRSAWPGCASFLAPPLLRRFAEKTKELEHCCFCVAVFEQADDERSDTHSDNYEVALRHQNQVRLWLAWMIDHQLEAEGSKKSPLKYLSLGEMARLSCVLADGDLEAFRSIFPAAARYNPSVPAVRGGCCRQSARSSRRVLRGAP